MKRFCEYTLPPDLNNRFSTIANAFIFLEQESKKIDIDFEKYRKIQTSTLERFSHYSDQGLRDVTDLFRDSFDSNDEFGCPNLKIKTRNNMVNILIRRDIYIPVMDRDLYPDLSLCKMEFCERYPSYLILLEMAFKVASLYSATDFENLKIPKAVIPVNFKKGDIIPRPRYKPEHYMKMYLDNNMFSRPSITMLKGIIRYHLITQNPKAKRPKKADFSDLLQMVSRIDKCGYRLSQKDIVDLLDVTQFIAKKIKKILKSNKELMV